MPAGLTTTATPPAAGAHPGGAPLLPDAVEPLVAYTPTKVLLAVLSALAVELLMAWAEATPPLPATALALPFCEARACAELPPVASLAEVLFPLAVETAKLAPFDCACALLPFFAQVSALLKSLAVDVDELLFPAKDPALEFTEALACASLSSRAFA